MKRSGGTGFVYFIASEAQKAVKVGFTSNIYQRLKTLQSGNPEELTLIGSVPATPEAEVAIHAALKKRRIRLEWYSDDDWLVERLIDEMQATILECAVRYLADTGFTSTDPAAVATAIDGARGNFFLTAEDVTDLLEELTAFPAPMGLR